MGSEMNTIANLLQRHPELLAVTLRAWHDARAAATQPNAQYATGKLDGLLLAMQLTVGARNPQRVLEAVNHLGLRDEAERRRIERQREQARQGQ